MKSISTPSPSSSRRRSNGFYKFLKPGALAQIRNSKITARSHRLASVLPHFPPHHLASATQIPVADREQIPQFIRTVYAGPLCLRRKKLTAAKSVYLLNLDLSPGLVLGPASTDSVINVLSSDVHNAH